MRILVTGAHGYIGSVLTPLLEAAGHEVCGVDCDFFVDRTFGTVRDAGSFQRIDVRDLQAHDLADYDVIMHLAALSNDPLGNLNSDWTHEINHRATVRLARMAREAGVPKFIFSSSCSSYGAAGDALLDEDAELNPVTAYGASKVASERELLKMASSSFTPVMLRNATAYGASPRLRLDLVVNEFVAAAATTGEILIKSDGTPWRPLVHVEDIARTFLAVAEAPSEAVHARAFNVGDNRQNYRVSELAEMVSAIVPGSRIHYAEGGGPDVRCYRVCCDRIRAALPGYETQWTVQRGVEQLYEAFRDGRLPAQDLEGPRYRRLPTLQAQLDEGLLDHQLRYRVAPAMET